MVLNEIKKWNNKRILNNLIDHDSFMQTITINKKSLIKYFNLLNNIQLSLLDKADKLRLAGSIALSMPVMPIFPDDFFVTGFPGGDLNQKVTGINGTPKEINIFCNDEMKKYIYSFKNKSEQEKREIIELKGEISKHNLTYHNPFFQTFIYNFDQFFYNSIAEKEKEIIINSLNDDLSLNSKNKRRL